MKLLPSLQTMRQESVRTFLRFPVAITVGWLITILGITLIEIPYDSVNNFTIEYLSHTLLSLLFGFPLFASFELMAERNKIAYTKFILGNIGILALVAIYYFVILPNPVAASESGWSQPEVTRTILITACSFLFATFGPFIAKKENMGIWQYNKHIVINLFLTFVYSLVLFIGISLIITTLESLFEIFTNNSDIYQEVLILIAGIISPLLFFSKTPTDINRLNNEPSLPHIVKNFAQYILTPLLTAYTLILYAYTIKVLITQEWPSGLIGPMVIGYAVSGIATLLILHPYSFLIENRWMNTMRRIFYIALIPLVILLFFSVGLRISEYAITENRYYVLLLGLWLLTVSIYALFVKEKDIKLIPMSISVLLILSLFGPWSSFSIAHQSQTNRFLEIVNRYNLIENGQISVPINQAPSLKINNKDLKELSAILNYFTETHNYSSVTPLIKNSLPSDFEEMNNWNKSEALFKTFGLPQYVYDYAYVNDIHTFIGETIHNTIDSTGFDKISFIQIFSYDDGISTNLNVNQKAYKASLEKDTLVLKDGEIVTAQISLNDKLKELLNKNETAIANKNSYYDSYHSFDINETAIDFEASTFKARLYIQSATVKIVDEKYELDNLEGILLSTPK